MVAEALDSFTCQAVKLFRGARKRCVKKLERYENEKRDLVVRDGRDSYKREGLWRMYLLPDPPLPYPKKCCFQLNTQFTWQLSFLFQVLLATVSANDMKYLFGALLDILVIWLLYPSLLIVICTTPHCFSCCVSDFCRLFLFIPYFKNHGRSILNNLIKNYWILHWFLGLKK